MASLIAVSLLSGSVAKADPGRDFLVSCSYGVLAGTLVGAASLAFSNKPGENLNRVARGASLGLYAGILLGFYVVYGGPSAEDDMSDILGQTPSQLRAPSEYTKWALVPIINERGWDGVSAHMRVFEF